MSCKSDGLIARENHQKAIQRILIPYEIWAMSIETLANQFTQLLPMKQNISVSETQVQHHNKQWPCINQRTQSAITIDAQHKNGDWVGVELALRQVKMEATRVDQTLSQDD